MLTYPMIVNSSFKASKSILLFYPGECLISSGVPTGLSFLATLLALDPNKIATNPIKKPTTMAYDISASIDLII